MDTFEVIAVVRDISIIILIGLWLIGMVAAGVIGIRIYRLVKRIASGVKESYQAMLNGITRPLLRMRRWVSSLGRIPSSGLRRVRQQFQARQGGMRITRGSLVMVMTGVSAGVLAGLLLAPKPGRETRQMLKSQAGAFKNRVSRYAPALRDGQQNGTREQYDPEAMLEVKVTPTERVEAENFAGAGRRSNQGRRRQR
jgi:YtxH-like protein